MKKVTLELENGGRERNRNDSFMVCSDLLKHQPYVLFCSGITRAFFGSDFVTVTKSEGASWDFLKPEIFAAIMDFYSSGEPLFLDATTAASKDTTIHEDDSEVVAMIKGLLETHIRPAVQGNGGDIESIGFHPDTGVVKLKMQGPCSGCPSSSVTFKSGIENMLMHYVPDYQRLNLWSKNLILNKKMEN